MVRQAMIETWSAGHGHSVLPGEDEREDLSKTSSVLHAWPSAHLEHCTTCCLSTLIWNFTPSECRP
jgi:hypothetical protein